LLEVAQIPSETLLYIDETGIDSYLYREHCWSKRGEKVYAEVCGKKFRRVGIVAAQRGNEIIAPLQYDGTMDSALFEAWFETSLLPAAPRGSVIVMDNASFHRKVKLRELVQAKELGHRLLFLPPYSPELNHIEHFWSWLKRTLAKSLHMFHSFDDALCAAFQLV